MLLRTIGEGPASPVERRYHRFLNDFDFEKADRARILTAEHGKPERHPGTRSIQEKNEIGISNPTSKHYPKARRESRDFIGIIHERRATIREEFVKPKLEAKRSVMGVF